MAINYGSKPIKEIWYGSKKVKEVWYGSKKVWSNAVEMVIQSSMSAENRVYLDAGQYRVQAVGFTPGTTTPISFYRFSSPTGGSGTKTDTFKSEDFNSFNFSAGYYIANHPFVSGSVILTPA